MLATPSPAPTLAWDRINTALRQYERDHANSGLLPELLERLPRVIAASGAASTTRRMVQRIGRTLLDTGLAPTILAPTCPDYSHRDGRYTCTSVHGGTPLLAHRHIDFLDRVTESLPRARVVFLLADQEADDPVICRVCRVEPEEFRRRVEQSILATREAVERRGWQAEAMTRYVPHFRHQSTNAAREIAADSRLRGRLASESDQRSRLYALLDPSMTTQEAETRTARTAGQYVALGTFAAERDMLICNHSTTNLGWYNNVGTAVLHHPIDLY
ncbi:hypothetical protein SAMN05216266_111206 [Amycolatopsis marina]|uniref:Uncharacterized protein n=1 Tax=Amycolatopsis marina TaxID=490629 RepID=A0A1I1B253_9PSEU|nr:hypothetical protein [Amycolatopsis marina]SFB44425.1 hypothetical protein SAMN05216266_111206 [Amycolatopsis marina]